MNQSNDKEMPAFLPALILFGAFGLVLVLLLPRPSTSETPLEPTEIAALSTEIAAAQSASTATQISATETTPPTQVVQSVAYSPAQIMEGEGVYQTTCATCHGFDAHGIPGLGKNLVESTFVTGQTDEELLHFIIQGRDMSDPLNTTGMMMPPRGGNPALTDEQLTAVIAYLRSESGMMPGMQMPMQSQPTVQAAVQSSPTNIAPTPALPTQTTVAILPTRTEEPFDAQAAFNWSCAGCHGGDGAGNPPYGDGFLSSDLLADPAALIAFLTQSHPPVDPAVDYPHPVRGGYPILTDEQLALLTDYLLTMVSQN